MSLAPATTNIGSAMPLFIIPIDANILAHDAASVPVARYVGVAANAGKAATAIMRLNCAMRILFRDRVPETYARIVLIWPARIELFIRINAAQEVRRQIHVRRHPRQMQFYARAHFDRVCPVFSL